jgi:hypothetical protein
MIDINHSTPHYKSFQLSWKVKCKASEAHSLRGGGGELGKHKTLSLGLSLFAQNIN